MMAYAKLFPFLPKAVLGAVIIVAVVGLLDFLSRKSAAAFFRLNREPIKRRFL